MTAPATLPGLNVPPWSLELDRAVLGIDPSTKRMSAAVIYPVAERARTAFAVSTLSLPQPGTDAARLALGQRALVPWLGAILAAHNPVLVVVEQPFAAAKHVPPVSYYAIGVLLAVLGTFDVTVGMVTPAQWKRAALGAGRGGVRKPKRGEGEYAVLTWARQAGYDGDSWDEADSIGIATAGGVLLDERERRATD